MGKRVKFNVHDIFMESQNTTADRTLFVSSPLFGIFTSLYNRAEGRIKVGLLQTKQTGSGIKYVTEVTVVNRYGLRLAEIRNHGDKYDSVKFQLYRGPLENGYASSMMKSSNPKYVQHKLSKNSGHEIATTFDHVVKEGETALNAVIYNMIDTSIDNKFGSRLSGMPVFDKRNTADDQMITFLAKYFAGEVQQSEMLPVHRSEFESMFAKYKENMEKFRTALKDTFDMISTEKWVFANNVNGGVLLGGIRPEPMCAAVEKYMANGALPMRSQFSYIDVSEPFKWYPSYQHIPEEIRQQLDFSVVMLKTHTGCAGTLPTEHGYHYYRELGCYYKYSGPDEAAVYVLTK